MGLLNWMRQRETQSARVKAVRELSEFTEAILSVHPSGLGLLMVQAADVAECLFEKTSGKIDLRSPRDAMTAKPSLLYDIEEEAIKRKKAGRQAEAASLIPWVHTLRAVLIPELKQPVTEMWQAIFVKGRPYADEAEVLFREVAAGRRQNNIAFRVIPDGFSGENGSR